MKKIVLPVALTLFAGALMGAANIHSAADGTSGKALFLENKCNKCHSIESQDIKRIATPPGKLPPDLSSVGKERSASWIEDWLQKKVELNGRKHLKKWDGSEDDLHTVAKWLASLKK